MERVPEIIIESKIRLRPLLCCPERSNRARNQPYFLTGDEIFSYIWRCLCPPLNRSTCATRYDFTLWGQWLEPIVRYFKDRARNGAIDGGDAAALYAYLEEKEHL